MKQSTAMPCLDASQISYSFKNNGRFTHINTIIQKLQSKGSVGESVPNGVKQNISFILNNEYNKERRKEGKRSTYLDDCWPWTGNSSKKLVYGLFNDKYKLVKPHNGKYFTYWGPKLKKYQLFPKETLTIFIYTCYLAQSKQYKKKVIQVIEKSSNLPDQLLNTQIVEYVGKFPGFIQIPKNGLSGDYNDECVLTKCKRLKNDLKNQCKQKVTLFSHCLYFVLV